MPIYEYKCSSCESQFEKMVKISAPVPACPTCASEDVRKLVSGGSFVLKGGGWYKDHYGLKSTPKADGGSSTPAAAPKAPTSGGGDA